MAFDKEFYAFAEAEIKERKAANERELAAREREIFGKFPQCAEYQRTLANTGRELVKILGGEAIDVAKFVEQLATENMLTQAKIEELLVNNGYRSNYLSPIYTCEKCKDSGIHDGKRCSCFMDIVRRKAAAQLNESSPIKLCSFDRFDLGLYPDAEDANIKRNIRKVMAHNLACCKSFAEDFHLPSNGLLLYGDTGLGKTHLSLAIANSVIEKGYSVIYGSAPNLFRKIEKEHFGAQKGEDTFELFEKVDLLILDDLGAEFDSQFYSTTLYNLLNSRLNAGLPIIINTNLDLQALKKRYGDRILSRMLTLTDLLFVGNDIRIIKSRG